MPSVPVELSNVVSYVLERADENDLDVIAQAMDRRRLDLDLQEATATAVTVGATVTIGDVFRRT